MADEIKGAISVPVILSPNTPSIVEFSNTVRKKLDGAINPATINSVMSFSKVAYTTYQSLKMVGRAVSLVGSAVSSVAEASAGIIFEAANQDLAIEKLAAKLNISKSAAWEMKSALDALGESLEDVSKTPELKERYDSLVADGRQMMPTGDYDDTMKGFRDGIFEVTRLKQEAGYAVQNIGYQFMKSFKEPIGYITAAFKKLNDTIVTNMPAWSEKAGQVFSNIYSLIKPFWNLLTKFFEMIGERVIRVGQDISGVSEWFANSGIHGALVSMGEAIAGVMGLFLDLGSVIWKIAYGALSLFFETLGKSDIIIFFRDLLVLVVDIIALMVKTIVSAVRAVSDLFKQIADNKEFKKFWESAGKYITWVIELLTGALGSVGKLGRALLELVKGNYKVALTLANEALGNTEKGKESKKGTPKLDGNYTIGSPKTENKQPFAIASFDTEIISKLVGGKASMVSMFHNTTTNERGLNIHLGGISVQGTNLSTSEVKMATAQGVGEALDLVLRGQYVNATTSLTGIV